MKSTAKFLGVIIWVAVLILCATSCGSKRIEGIWYAVPEETMFSFDNGVITSGGYPAGQYTREKDGYIVSTGKHNYNSQLYIVNVCGTSVLSTTPDNDGSILYCRDLDKIDEVVEYILVRAAEAMKYEVPKAELVTYDSIIAGKHPGEVVAIEAVVRSYEYSVIGYKGYYDIGLGYWSDKENKYIYDEFPGSICAEDVHKTAVEQLRTFGVGDKIKITIRVNDDNSFGLSSYKWAELIEKDYLG